MTLYDLKDNLINIEEQLDELINEETLTEEEKAENANKLLAFREKIKGLIVEKNEGLIQVIKNKEAVVNTLKAEEDRLKKRRQSQEKSITKLKEYMLSIMEELHQDKIETSLATISKRKNPISLEIVDESLIPVEYLNSTIVVNKKGIMDEYKKTGVLALGTKIIDDKYSIMIK